MFVLELLTLWNPFFSFSLWVNKTALYRSCDIRQCLTVIWRSPSSQFALFVPYIFLFFQLFRSYGQLVPVYHIYMVSPMLFGRPGQSVCMDRGYPSCVQLLYYCMSKMSGPIFFSKLQNKMGQDFLDIQYVLYQCNIIINNINKKNPKLMLNFSVLFNMT